MQHQFINSEGFSGGGTSGWRWSIHLNLHYDWQNNVEVWRTPDGKQIISDIEEQLKDKAKGPWSRIGNVIYTSTLDDAYMIRMLFDPHIKFIKEAENHPSRT